MIHQIDYRGARWNSRLELEARKARRDALNPIAQLMHFCAQRPPPIHDRNMALFALAIQAVRTAPSLRLQRIMPSDVSSSGIPAVLQRLGVPKIIR